MTPLRERHLKQASDKLEALLNGQGRRILRRLQQAHTYTKPIGHQPGPITPPYALQVDRSQVFADVPLHRFARRMAYTGHIRRELERCPSVLMGKCCGVRASTMFPCHRCDALFAAIDSVSCCSAKAHMPPGRGSGRHRKATGFDRPTCQPTNAVT
jgi:hypothetical protein